MVAVVTGGRPGGGDSRNTREGIGALPIRIGGGGAHAGAGEGSRALDGRYEVHGFRHRGHTVDLTVDGDQMTVTLDEKQLYAGRRQRVEIL